MPASVKHIAFRFEQAQPVTGEPDLKKSDIHPSLFNSDKKFGIENKSSSGTDFY